jgi:Tfp pilus assembly protein PilF
MFYVIFIILVALIVVSVIAVMRNISAPKQMGQIQKLIESGNTKAAAGFLKNLLIKNENNISAHWMLAQVYQAEKKFELCVVEYKFIIKINRFTADVPEQNVREKLALLYESFGQLDEAQKEYLLLTKLDPENGQYYYKIGELFYRRNYTDKALSYLNNAIKLSADLPDAHYYLGVIYYNKGMVKDSLENFNKALQIAPAMHKVHYYLGLINRTLGIFDKARSEFQHAQRDPDFKTRAMLENGRILFQMDNVREAVVELERALSFFKDENEISMETRYVLAACYEKARDLPRAIEQWEAIDSYRKGFKDVPQKLSLYQDLRTDDHLKDFLTAPKETFIDISRKVITSMGFDILETIPVDDDGVDFLATELEGKWRNTKRSNRIIKIRRDSSLVSELLVREIQEEMKKFGANRGIIISSAGFAPSAQEFALTRPIDLMDRKQLTAALKTVTTATTEPPPKT